MAVLLLISFDLEDRCLYISHYISITKRKRWFGRPKKEKATSSVGVCTSGKVIAEQKFPCLV